MDLSSFSAAEITQDLRAGSSASAVGRSAETKEDVFEELHAQRVQLEMQNRALREAEGEIEAAYQRYCDLYDHLPIGYVTLTSKGLITQANLTAAGWLRRDRAQLVGSYFSWFLGAFDAGRFAAHIDSCLKSGVEQTLELTLRLESGLLLTVQLTSRLAPKDPDGEPQVHTAITNITKLRQARVIANDIAAEQQGTAQSLSDSIRAPLDSIHTFARTLLRDHAADLSVDLTNMIERMECASVRMDSTLRHLLEYCCLGHEEVALDPVSLEELTQHVIMEHRFIIERRGAEIIVERPLPCVRGARLLLGQVLASILTHALRNTKSDERPRLRVAATQQGKEVVLKVSDECQHVDQPPAEENFQVFDRLHEKDGFHGAAVGLAVLRHAIERMHGRVWVEPAAGKVTSFNIGLPAV